MLTSLINSLEELNAQFNDFKTPADVNGHPLSDYDLEQIEVHEEEIDRLSSDMEDVKEQLEGMEKPVDRFGNELEDYDLDKMDENEDAIERVEKRLDEVEEALERYDIESLQKQADALEARLDIVENEIPTDSKALELEKRLSRTEHALRIIRGALIMLSDSIAYILDGKADDSIYTEYDEDDSHEDAVDECASKCHTDDE